MHLDGDFGVQGLGGIQGITLEQHPHTGGEGGHQATRDGQARHLFLDIILAGAWAHHLPLGVQMQPTSAAQQLADGTATVNYRCQLCGCML